jgi:hypothetical protein
VFLLRVYLELCGFGAETIGLGEQVSHSRARHGLGAVGVRDLGSELRHTVAL